MDCKVELITLHSVNIKFTWLWMMAVPVLWKSVELSDKFCMQISLSFFSVHWHPWCNYIHLYGLLQWAFWIYEFTLLFFFYFKLYHSVFSCSHLTSSSLLCRMWFLSWWIIVSFYRGRECIDTSIPTHMQDSHLYRMVSYSLCALCIQ